MGWIKDRILAEQRKHEKSGLDWARLAEAKILASIVFKISGGEISSEDLK